MFSSMHLLILVFCAVFIVAITVYAVKKRVPLRKMLSFMVGVTIFGELMKVFSRIIVQDGAALLSVEFLPLHLCSIQIFALWFLRFFNKSPQTEKTLLAFMYPTMLVGGAAALLIATVTPISLANPEIYEYFVYHASVVAFGLYIPLTKQVDFTWKRLGKTMAILAILFFFSIYFNAMFSQGIYRANFFYSSFPPLPGLPYLNFSFFGRTLSSEKLGWIWYLVKLVFLGFVVILSCYAPFLIKNARIKKASDIA
ncbi:MAG: hypothetical protein A2Y16_02900 [Tenericutes bacterium GWF2_57_13]|nr:MAG: hypothetical protein A2Y16_02900 [Tenericutes bacterium GWF2_57_13]